MPGETAAGRRRTTRRALTAPPYPRIWPPRSPQTRAPPRSSPRSTRRTATPCSFASRPPRSRRRAPSAIEDFVAMLARHEKIHDLTAARPRGLNGLIMLGSWLSGVAPQLPRDVRAFSRSLWKYRSSSSSLVTPAAMRPLPERALSLIRREQATSRGPSRCRGRRRRSRQGSTSAAPSAVRVARRCISSSTPSGLCRSGTRDGPGPFRPICSRRSSGEAVQFTAANGAALPLF